ncbi:hypothetical protein G9A89_012941 [Geosiphon pyriformis]|nr:hypothetical protein G9A89_012941 [Geosiphon pyriformis]
MSGFTIPYNERAEWNDVIPIPQDDGPDPLAPIAYAKEYSNAMDYFRAISRKGELSDRALELTEHIIELNPAHYTIWNYRQQILFSLDKDLYKELEFVQSLAEANPKNYQLWHHRQLILDKLNDSSRELSFLSRILIDDSKNYHAWSYRQWVNKRFDLWDEELQFVDSLLVEDVRNNSAWNHRYYVIFHKPEEFTKETLNLELRYSTEKIMIAPNNISPWNYIKGLITRLGEDIGILEEVCKEIQEKNIVSAHVLGCLVDIYEKRAREGSEKDKLEGIKNCILLAEEHDTIRRKPQGRRRGNFQALDISSSSTLLNARLLSIHIISRHDHFLGFQDVEDIKLKRLHSKKKISSLSVPSSRSLAYHTSMLGKGLLKKKILKESDLTNCPPAKTPIPLAGVVDGKITKPIWLLHQTNKFNVELYKRPLPKTELWKPKNGQPQKSNAGVKILKGFWGKNSQGPKPPPGYYDR